MGRINDNRGGGSHRKVDVKPPSALSRDFTPINNNLLPMSLDDMVDKALSAGFKDADSQPARFLLGRVSFQHISEYFPLLENESYNAIRYIKTINSLMTVDRKFQLILLEFIGMFELQLRSRYSRDMALKYGPFAHRKPKLFKDQNYYDDFLKRYAQIQRAARQRTGSRAKRDIVRFGDMPIWEAVEEMPLGMISKLYSNTKSRSVRESVANSFGVDPDILSNWMRTISVTRNRCAHFGKLLGEKLPIMPKCMPEIEADNEAPFYVALMLLRLLRTNTFFHDFTLAPSIAMAMQLIHLFDSNRKTVHILLVQDDWESIICSKSLTGVELEINGRTVAAKGEVLAAKYD